jgi:hypothetical protein
MTHTAPRESRRSFARQRGDTIDRDLDCADATLTNEGGIALFADGVEVGGNAFLRGGFTATGEVRLPGAKVGGQLNCTGATLTSKGGIALFADGVEVGGSVLLGGGGFTAMGEMRLPRAKVGAQLECNGAKTLQRGRGCPCGRRC